MCIRKIYFVLLALVLVIPLAFAQPVWAKDEKQDSLVDTAALPERKEEKFKFKYIEKTDLEKTLIQEIPYAKEAKYFWKFADGDIDIYFENLRIDRRNKGLVYSFNSLPGIGEIHNVEFKLKAGEDIRFLMETNHIPFMGELEGFKLKAGVGTDESHVFLRYSVPILPINKK